MLPPAVMWIDPGMDTGLALLTNSRDFYADEYQFMQAAGAISYTCRAFGERLWIGWERYDIDRRMPQQDAHHAIEMIGVARREATEKNDATRRARAHTDVGRLPCPARCRNSRLPLKDPK